MLAARVLQMADGAVAAFRMPFGAFLRGMTRHDGYFHVLMAGTAIAGFLLMNSAGESLWDYLNRGVSQPCTVDKAGDGSLLAPASSVIIQRAHQALG